jgi:hypothetical protein
MVPVEVTAFGLLAVCVILLAGVLFVTLVFPREAAIFARYPARAGARSVSEKSW